jgi:RNA polymerase sigma-70 factor, ECF subfamily
LIDDANYSRRFVYNRLRSRQAAEDVTSEVFVKALRAIPRFQFSGRPFRAWLYQIASNATVDYVRALRPSVGPAADDVGPTLGPAVSGDFPEVIAALAAMAEASVAR